MRFLGLDLNGTDGSDPVRITARYLHNGQVAHIPFNTAPENVTAVVYAVLGLDNADAARHDAGQTRLQAVTQGLNALSVEDRSYAITARIMAYKEGAANAAILAINSKAAASAYVTGLTKWTNVPASTRPMLATMLETMAGIVQVALLTLE